MLVLPILSSLIWSIFGREYKLWGPSLCNSVYLPILISWVQIFSSAFCFQTCSSCIKFHIQLKISYIVTLKFLDMMQGYRFSTVHWVWWPGSPMPYLCNLPLLSMSIFFAIPPCPLRISTNHCLWPSPSYTLFSWSILSCLFIPSPLTGPSESVHSVSPDVPLPPFDSLSHHFFQSLCPLKTTIWRAQFM
jgi:hypothetical protein